jgi:hypothetical protein
VECVVVDSPPDVRARLRQLDIDYEECIEVVKAMIAAANGCTDNDPPSARGWDSWRFGVRRWRDIKLPQGWHKDETENLSTVVHPDAKFRIAVSNTDESTGLRWGHPKSRTVKGEGSRRAVDLNRQPPLPIPEFEEAFKRQLLSAAAAQAQIWYLCLFNDGESVRAELSKPGGIEGGHFIGWHERIILMDDEGPVGDRAIIADNDFGPDVEVKVRRRA